MGCGNSRAVPAGEPGFPPEKDEQFEYEQQRKSPASTSAAPSPQQPAQVQSKESKAGSAKKTPAANTQNAGDDTVAVALRSKRKGFVVDGTSVQVGGDYQRKIIAKSQDLKDMIMAALKDNVLFAGYGKDSLLAMIDAMEPREVTAGTVIIQQGEAGDNFYAIESGKFEIVVNDKKIADWGEGTKNRTVGELALLYNAPRAATVRAVSSSKLWSIDRATFRALVANAAFAQHKKMKESLRKGLLEDLSDEQLDKVAAASSIVTFKRGEQIIKKGEDGEVFYIIDQGSVICKNLPGEQSNNILHSGDYFGERALLKKEPRAADVYAEEDTTLIALHREDFENLLGHLRQLLESNMGTRLLLCVPLLAQLGNEERQVLFSRLRLVTYKDGAVIMAQETSVQHFYIVNEGSVKVTRREGELKGLKIASRLHTKAEGATDATLGNGQWFGDDEVGDGSPSPATFSAVGQVQCFVLDAKTYADILAPFAREMQQQAKSAVTSPARPKDAAGTVHSAPSEARPAAPHPPGAPAATAPAKAKEVAAKRARLGLPMKELEFGPTLGTGTFGRVKLVYHRKSGRVYALKMLQKAQIVAQKQQANIQAERDLLMKVDHPFIIKLYDTYKDRDRLYMLMECVQGGELFSRLQNSPTPGRVTPAEARFYAACVLDAFEHLHTVDIVYRDLKPENLLIDSEGYLKIVDFGFAKIVRDKTYTLCGTPEYLAPELVLGKGHDKGVDYWALGILLYEQVAGYSPFADHDNNDQMVICRNILKGEVDFPAHFKDEKLKDLILRLLVKDIARRLGCMRGGAGDIKSHRFFRDVDWEALLAKKIPAPWKPKLSNPLDTSHFDEYEEDDSCERYHDDGSGWDKDF